MKEIFSKFVPEWRRREETNKELKLLLTPAKDNSKDVEAVEEVLDELFKHLTPEQDKVMRLKYRSSGNVLTNQEVAKVLGKNRWNVHKIHFRAMKRLREIASKK